MINSKRLLPMARKWQKYASQQRKKISLKRTPSQRGSSVAVEGHFVIYTVDGSWFMISLAYLNRPIFQELLSMAEEEFGFMRCGPLLMPCEASIMEYIVSLLSKNACVEVEKALVSITSCREPLPFFGLHRIIPDNNILCGF